MRRAPYNECCVDERIVDRDTKSRRIQNEKSALHFRRNSVAIAEQLRRKPDQNACTLLQRVAVKPSVALVN
jgi:DNA-binding transcriptional regulator YiaG